jgi:hypothetical protein
MRPFRTIHAAVLAIALIAPWTGCRSLAPGSAVPDALAVCIPSDTLALAGVNLDRLRASPLYRMIPPGAAALLQPLREASYLLLAYNGKDVLAVASGRFREAPPGAVLLAKDLAVSGSPDAIRAATAQRQTGRTGAGWLLDRAPAGGQIWAAAQGGVAFPLPGDAANLNRFLSFTEYANIAVRLDSGVHIEALGAGRTPESAERLEESLRAFLTLAAAGAARDRPLADLLHAIQLHRDALAVRLSFAATPDQIVSLLRYTQLP